MPIDVNYYDKVVYITSPTASVTVQELVDAMRTAEDSVEGMQFGDPVKSVVSGFVDAEGKATLGGGFSTVITMTLDSDWYIEFWDGVLLGQVADGNVVGGKDSRPVRAALGSADTVLVLGAERGVITAGGVSQSDIDSMADAVWDEQRSEHTDSGSFGATDEWASTGFDAVYISSSYGVSGTSGNIGSRQNPVDNMADATTIASNRNLRRFVFLDSQTYTLTQAYANWLFEGENFATLNMNGQNVAGSNILRLVVTGQGSPAALLECYVTLTTLSATMSFRCAFVGNNTFNGNITLNQTYFNNATMIRSNGGLTVINGHGKLTISSVVGSTHSIYGFHGRFGVAVSCTGGAIVLEGCGGLLIDGSTSGCSVDAEGFTDTRATVAADTRAETGSTSTVIKTDLQQVDEFFDGMQVMVCNVAGTATRTISDYAQSNGEITVDTALPFTPADKDQVYIISGLPGGGSDLTAVAIADAIWDEQRSGHTDAGSFGATDEWTGDVDTDSIADAVWDELRSGHTTTGTFGATDEWASAIDGPAIASAVWDALQTDYGTPGTMGWLQNLIELGVISKPRLIPGD
jgi:hypothetical protein